MGGELVEIVVWGDPMMHCNVCIDEKSVHEGRKSEGKKERKNGWRRWLHAAHVLLSSVDTHRHVHDIQSA